MTEHNIRLVGSIAARFVRRSDLTFDDLTQEGAIGLMKAAFKFDPSLGYKFSTYATPWIEQSIRRALSEQGLIIRLPVYKYEQLCRLAAVMARLAPTGETRPPIEQIAKEMDLPVEKVRELLTITNQPDSLDEIISHHHNSEYDKYYFLPDNNTPNPDKIATQNILEEKVTEALECLTAREAKILKLRYGMDGGGCRTLIEIGDIFGLSRERIRQIEADALHKLTSSFSVWKLREFAGVNMNNQIRLFAEMMDFALSQNNDLQDGGIWHIYQQMGGKRDNFYSAYKSGDYDNAIQQCVEIAIFAMLLADNLQQEMSDNA